MKKYEFYDQVQKFNVRTFFYDIELKAIYLPIKVKTETNY